MTLQNLVGISLDRITPAKETIKRLLEGAARHIADAKVQAISGVGEPRGPAGQCASNLMAIKYRDY